MIALLKKLLPTGDEAEKLRFEAWKTSIVAGGIPLLAAILGLSIPKSREWIVSGSKNAWTWTGSVHEIFGWVILVLSVFAIYGLWKIGQSIHARQVPAYTKSFINGEYNGVIWRWQWKGTTVDIGHMHGFCPTCDTELIIETKTTVHDRKDTSIFCTTCNNAWGISNVADLRDHIRRKIERDARIGSRAPEGKTTLEPQRLMESAIPDEYEELDVRILQLAYDYYPEQYTKEEYMAHLNAPTPDVFHSLRKLERLRCLYKSNMRDLRREGQPNPDGYRLLDRGIEIVKQLKQSKMQLDNR